MSAPLPSSAPSLPDAPQPRPQIATLPDVAHGALDFGELERAGLRPHDVIDFSVNSNPFGPSPRVRQALRAIPPERYPDRHCLALRRALAARHNLAIEHILIGNGAAELIWLVALAWLDPQRSAFIVGPTFGEYARAARLMGAPAHTWTASPARNFDVDLADVEQALAAQQPAVVFWCNPNNPTGVFVPDAALNALAARHPATLFVVDEAYRRFVAGRPERPLDMSALPPNLLILRSMTKDYALAGLRLGYAVGRAEVIQALAAAQPPWSVNAAAQAAGLAALDDDAHVTDTLARLAAITPAFQADLRRAGLRVWPSATHFFLAQVGDGARFRRALLRAGVQVRDCASFGLPDCVRIATRRPEENARLLEAVQQQWPL